MKRSARNTDTDEAVAGALDRLREELAVVRQVLDEVLNELQWANRNRDEHDDSWRVGRRITSMPVDPTADDWAERLNRYSADDLPDIDEREVTSAEPGRLF